MIESSLTYLEDNLEILSSNLYTPVFQTVLKELWNALTASVVDIACPQRQERMVTDRQVSFILLSTECLGEFMLGGGEGLRESFVKRKAQDVLNTIAAVRTATPRLIEVHSTRTALHPPQHRTRHRYLTTLTPLYPPPPTPSLGPP
jgi:hypothetical protein